MLALTVFGLIALLRLRTDEFPDVAPPFVSVAIPYPGASPDGVEKEVLDPIEEQIAAISGVKKINGTAEDGFGVILVEFVFEKPLAEATQDIRDAIQRDPGRPAGRDEGTDHQEAQRHRSADRLARAQFDAALAGRAHPARRSRRSPASCGRFRASRKWPSRASSSVSSRSSSARAIFRPPGSAWRRWCRRCSCRTLPRRSAGSRASSTSARSGSRAGSRGRTSSSSWW